MTLLLLPYLFHSSVDCFTECSVAFLLCRSVLPTLLDKHANGDRLATADSGLYKSSIWVNVSFPSVQVLLRIVAEGNSAESFGVGFESGVMTPVETHLSVAESCSEVVDAIHTGRRSRRQIINTTEQRSLAPMPVAHIT